MHEEWPSDLGADAIVRCVALGWQFELGTLHHLQVGGGGHHWHAVNGLDEWFVTVDDLDTKDWFGPDRAQVLEGLTGALRAAAILREHLEFVVAPIPTTGGAPVRPLGERYAVSVYPFLRGMAGVFGPHPDPVVRRGVLAMLARLHATPVPAGAPQYHRPAIGERAALAAFLRRPDEPWDRGPHGEAARAAFASEHDALCDRLAEFDAAAAHCGPHRHAVVTHGEPHGGNVMTVDGRLRLIDWDTVGVAAPERDLWFAIDDADDAAFYEAATGHQPEAALLDLYRRRWRWDDLAHAVAHFRGAHHDDPSSQRYLDAVPALLGDVLA